ncbi:MAG TPA: hypothetical protein VGX25_33820, partial [Actinophytocola sp.]|nr:hypothetical protein [Actinophytocola sp.]
MGIELPPELAGVAAQAGVRWPQADEDRMRQAAQAWRDAGTRLTHLTRDADHAARTALTSVEGRAGDAARRHWSAFVHPDTGHLTATARGCTAAADRLDHAAHQVGAAKVEIVRNLVALAQTSDAANQAAAAGHPHALLNLDTAVRGTAVNVSHITDNLVSAVQPGSGVDMSGVQNLVNPNPGGHGGPPTPITAAARGVATVATGTAADVVSTATGAPGNPAGTPANLLPPGVPGDLLPGRPGDLLPGVSGDVVPGRSGDLLPGVSGDVVPGRPGDLVPPGTLPPGVEPGNPDITGPVRVLPVGAEPGGVNVLPDAPTPPTGVPVGPGQTVQAGLAGAPVLDAPPPASAA